MPAWGRIASLLACVGALAGPANAQLTDLVSRTSFRVCADPANAPMSVDDGSGFENRIAELFSQKLGRPLEYFWFPMAQGFVRRTLLENRCDVIIGFAQGDELVLSTNAYYTSTHVLVTRADSDLADVTTLTDPRLKGRQIGVIAGSPAASHLADNDLLATTEGYRLMVDRRVESPNQQMLADLVAGDLDIAVMWGPIGGPLVKQAGTQLKLTPLVGEPGSPRLFYRISMGVRNGEDVWKRELNSTIRALQPEIDAILRDAGVPLLNDMGTALKPETAP
ncbi:MAG: substrate-binding domain-containing protein [Amaricoccus sp.]|uniref:substrate-binding domain-containing protein n=1 Tax=Amaricoccus sp. TaxID=1872485 RepID=UPI00331482AF